MKRIIIYFAILFLPKVIVASDLTTAIQNTNVVLAERLISEKNEINTQDKWGWTPLMWAASKGNIDLCRLLIANGAAVDVKDRDGSTILDYFRGQYVFGLKVEIRKPIYDLLVEAYQKQKGQLIIVDSSVAREQQLKDELETIKEAVSKNGDNAINIQDGSGKTPLMDFAADGNIEGCKFLLQNGANTDIKDKKGLTAIDYACKQLDKPDEKLKEEIINLLKSADK